MRKTFNSIIVTGDLIRKELIEEVSPYNNKEYRKVNFTVRYAPNMEITLTAKYNKINGKGEHSQMYDWALDAFQKYDAFVGAKMTGRDSSNKPIWQEVTNSTCDRVECKAELSIFEKPYRSQRTQQIEIGQNKSFKLNGKFGIAHATDKDQNGAKFSLEMFITKLDKQTVSDKELLIIYGYGVKDAGVNKFNVYPLVIKVPENGIQDTMDKFDDYDLKDGIVATLRGRVIKGQELITVGEEFDGTPILTSKDLDELRLSQKVDVKTIFDASEGNEKSISPEEMSKLFKERTERIEKATNELEASESFNSESNNTSQNESTAIVDDEFENLFK